LIKDIMKEPIGKRVLMLIENNTYPQDTRVRYEANTLVEAGYQVAVICPKYSPQKWRDIVDGVQVFRYPAPPEATSPLGYIWEYAYSLVATFFFSLLVWIRPGFDIIHSANPPDTAVFLVFFYKFFGKRFVFDHHDLVPDMYKVRFRDGGNQFIYRRLLWLERITCRYADHIIATNESYKGVEMQRGGVPADKITVVRNGPKLELLSIVEPKVNLKSKGKVIIAYVGLMGVQDGLDYLLQALRCLVDMHRVDFYCMIIGEGAVVKEMKALTSSLDLEKYVWFTGFIPFDEMVPYLSAADICVDPDPSNSYNDRCTMVKMMEYMALGKPIVAFDLPEHRVTAQAAALYARPNDERDFAQLIITLMDDPVRRIKMGQIGRERVKRELAWPYQAKHLLDAYESISARSK
jgi:glycosyltransferase involved in cell wall biosynthesis